MSCQKCSAQALESLGVCPKHFRRDRPYWKINTFNQLNRNVSKYWWAWLGAILGAHLVALAITWGFIATGVGGEANPITAASMGIWGIALTGGISLLVLIGSFALVWFYKKPSYRFIIVMLLGLTLFDMWHDLVLWILVQIYW